MCVIIGGVASALSLVSTFVREWASRDISGVTYTYGLWYMCVDNECEQLHEG